MTPATRLAWDLASRVLTSLAVSPEYAGDDGILIASGCVAPWDAPPQSLELSSTTHDLKLELREVCHRGRGRCAFIYRYTAERRVR